MEKRKKLIYEYNHIRRGNWNYTYAGKRKQELVDKIAKIFGVYLEIITNRPVAVWENVHMWKSNGSIQEKGKQWSAGYSPAEREWGEGKIQKEFVYTYATILRPIHISCTNNL